MPSGNHICRETLLWHLAQADARIALGQQQIDRQREIIAELEELGHEAITARALLVVFEATHACTSPTAIKSLLK
jgi:hypothetical protein